MNSTKRIFEETENGYNYYEETTSITVHEIDDNTTTVPVYRTTTRNTTTVTVEVIDLTTESEEESGNSRKKRKTENVPENFPEIASESETDEIEEFSEHIPVIVSESETDEIEEFFENIPENIPENVPETEMVCSICQEENPGNYWTCFQPRCVGKVCESCCVHWREMPVHEIRNRRERRSAECFPDDFSWKCPLCNQTAIEVLKLM